MEATAAGWLDGMAMVWCRGRGTMLLTASDSRWTLTAQTHSVHNSIVRNSSQITKQLLLLLNGKFRGCH